MLRPTVIFVLSLHSGARAQPSYAAPMIKQVVTAARSRPIVTDKVTTHSYQTMYGMFLVPLYYSTRSQFRRMKMLEIGLGCDQNYGPGASAKLWRDLFAGEALLAAVGDRDCLHRGLVQQARRRPVRRRPARREAIASRRDDSALLAPVLAPVARRCTG